LRERKRKEERVKGGGNWEVRGRKSTGWASDDGAGYSKGGEEVHDERKRNQGETQGDARIRPMRKMSRVTGATGKTP